MDGRLEAIAVTHPDSFAVEDDGRARPDGVLLALIGLAGLIRIAAARGDLWVDEVWTLKLLPRMLAASDVLFHLPYANNHPLNTLYLYLLGDVGDSFVVYRLHSILAGVATVALIGLVARPVGRLESRLAVLFAALSLPLVNMASEARGYGLMLFFAYLAFAAAQSAIDRPRLLPRLVFWAAVPLGFMANLYFVHAYTALCLWTPFAVWWKRRSVVAGAGELLWLHLLPLAASFAFYTVFYQPGLSGQQIPTSWSRVIAETGALALGVSEKGPLGWVYLAVALALALGGMRALARRGESSWLFFFGLVVVAPVLWLALARPIGLFPRFFSVAMAALPLLSALAMASLWRAGPGARRVAMAGTLALVVAGGISAADLIRHGRGHYGDALRWMAMESAGPVLRLSSNHDFSVGMMVDHYRHFVPDRRIEYVSLEASGPAPQWFVMQGVERPRLVHWATTLYEYERVFRSSRVSGYDWGLYRRVRPDRVKERMRAADPSPATP